MAARRCADRVVKDGALRSVRKLRDHSRQPRLVLDALALALTPRSSRSGIAGFGGAREVIEGVSHSAPELAAERVSELPLEHLAE